MRALPVSLLVTAVAIAGCLGSASQPDATAMDLKGVADSAALAWDEAPFLVEAKAIEANLVGLPADIQDRIDTGGPFGDGRASAWSYLYRNSEEERFLVTVGADRSIIAEQKDIGRGAAGEDPIVEWRIDSDEAAGVFAEHVPMWSDWVTRPDVNVFYVLGRDGAQASWVALLETPDEEASYGVSAVDGAYLGEVTLRYPIGLYVPNVTTEQGSFDGTLTPLEPTARHDIELTQDGHPSLHVTVTFSGAAAGAAVTIGLYVPDAQEPLDSTSGSASGVRVLVADAPAPGLWRLQLDLDQGVAPDYSVQWCAEGGEQVPGPGGQMQSPCGMVGRVRPSPSEA